MLDFDPETGLWGLFLSAFVSATLLPGNSEVVLLALLAKYPVLFWEAIVVGTLGNTLGGMTSYAIGYAFPHKAEQRAVERLRRYGAWILLLSWFPLIGDALCIAAGWLRINPWRALLMMAIGKCARYLALVGVWDWLVSLFGR